MKATQINIAETAQLILDYGDPRKTEQELKVLRLLAKHGNPQHTMTEVERARYDNPVNFVMDIVQEA